ncbi:MAG: patatin-like phospholipase family protein [Phototrophicaceae bacterium]|jgi:NTE family protein
MMKLGLALGGGGARGGAHVGAIRELLGLGLKPDLVTGTSIGALIGALYCAGMGIDLIEEALKAFKPSVMYELPQDWVSIMSPVKVEVLLEKRFSEFYTRSGYDIKRPTFADLEVPLAIVATDLVSKREVVIDSGDVIRAVMASLSVPVLFPPVQIGDWHLVDGGLVNNVPFDVARSRGAAFTIAIDLGNANPYGTPTPADQPAESLFEISNLWEGKLFDRAIQQVTRRPLWQVVTTVIDIVNAQNTRLNIATSPPDILLRPDIGSITLLDFHTLDASIEAGRLAVHRAAPEIERLLTRMKAAQNNMLTGGKSAQNSLPSGV